MEKLLNTHEILQNAKSIILFNQETIYVEPVCGEDVYGISRVSGGWYLKQNYWDYYDSSNMLYYFEIISQEAALRFIAEWERSKSPENKVEKIRLDSAVRFASQVHKGQRRKGTDIPYITHPLEVMNILAYMNADIDLQIAGVLHDTVEDTAAEVDDIVAMFGPGVAALVAHHSEDKSKSWEERKTHAIESLRQADKRLKMLVMADKLSNLRCMLADYREVGEKLWERFNAPVEKQSWYYSEIQDALWDMQLDPDTQNVYWEMVGVYKDVFVKFYRSKPEHNPAYLLQVPAHGGICRIDKGCPCWRDEPDPSLLSSENVYEVSRQEFEGIEDEWNAPFWDCIDRDLADSQTVLVADHLRHTQIRIQNKQLTMSGEDFGPACKKINGKDEYEYHISLDEENTARLLTHLRIKAGVDMSLSDVFTSTFGTQMPSTQLMEFCNEWDIEYSFVSF